MRSIFFTFLLVIFFSLPVMAQDQAGDAPLTPPTFPAQKDTSDDVDDSDRLSPALEAETQRMRQEWRIENEAETGLKWIPWPEAGQKVHDFIKERDPEVLNAIGDGSRFDIAIADADHDQKPDIILYDWSECTAMGCGITVYFDNKSRKYQTFYAKKIELFRDGVLIDDAGYFAY